MKIFKRIFFTLLTILLLLVAGGFIITHFYGEEVKSFIIEQLNKKLNTQVIIDPSDIDFTVLQNFPNASVEFKNVKVLEAIPRGKKDTLFKAGNISLQFNVVNLFQKNYRIKKIEIEDVSLKLKIYTDGSDNYHFLKELKDSSKTNFSFALEKIVLKDVLLSYKNQKNKSDVSVKINSSKLKGEFSNEKYAMDVTGNVFVNHFKSDNVNYLSGKPIDFAASFDVENDVYSIKNSSIKLADLKFESSGNINASSKLTSLHLDLKGKDIDIQSVISLLPEKQKQKFSDYESGGNFYFTSEISGSVDSPFIKADFGIENGNIGESESSVKLRSINIEGKYQNQTSYDKHKKISEQENITVKKFEANLAGGTVSGKFRINNFNSPDIKASLNGTINLEDVVKFLKIDTVETISGTLKMNAILEGKIKDAEKYTPDDFKNSKTSGEIKITDANLQLKNSPLTYTNFSAVLLLNNNDMAVENMKGSIGNSDFELSGFFKNILAFIFLEKEDLSIDAVLKSTNINLDELLMDKNTSTKSDTAYKLEFSERVNVNLSSEIGHLLFRQFDASSIRGKFILKNKKLIADPLVFNTMDGFVKVQGMIDGTRDDLLLITCDADIQRVNINKMFTQLENFGQTTMVDKNLNGKVTASIQFASVWKSDLTANLDKVYARSNMTIENGELINFEPMKELSRFIAVKELEHIKFSTLKNEIEIRNQKIHIPKMDVKSSALDITCSGVHTFDNEIDYRIKVLMNDLLSKKARKAKKENNEFGVEEDDGTGKTALFLTMKGTIDDPVIKYDTKGAKEKIKEDIQAEKQTLKSILRNEFGWFKKDTTLNKKKEDPKKENEKFIIKWNEEEKQTDKKEDEDY